MYPTTTALLEDLDDAGVHRPESVTLLRWREAGILRTLERHSNHALGFAWPDWTPRMIRLAALELGAPTAGRQPHGRRSLYDVLRHVAAELDLHPDAAFVTITTDDLVEAHLEADTVAHRCRAAGDVLIVAIPDHQPRKDT